MERVLNVQIDLAKEISGKTLKLTIGFLYLINIEWERWAKKRTIQLASKIQRY